MDFVNMTQNGLNGIFIGMNDVLLFLGFFTALLNCFFGFRLLRLWCAAIGFFVGAVTGFAISQYITGNMELSAVIAVAAGALLGILAFRVYLCGVFLLCGGLTSLLYALLVPVPALGALHWLLPVLGVMLGIAAGAIAVQAVRPSVIFITAAGGGVAAAGSAFALFGVGEAFPVAVAGLVLTLAGAAFQFRRGRPKQVLSNSKE